MKNKLKAILAAILCLAFLLSLCAAAVGTRSFENLTLSIVYSDAEEPISGVSFELYRVADFDEEGGFVFTDEFKNYPVEINTTDSEKLKSAAHALKGFVKRDGLKPCDFGETDGEGILTFPVGEKSLKSGLYLMFGEQIEKNGYIYSCEPVFVSLPGYSEKDGSYLENVTVSAKFGKTEIQSDTTEISVVKLWKNDKGIDRPKRLTVDLLSDGSVFDTAYLNSDNGWKYEWNELPLYDEDGSVIEWDVVERAVEDYTSSAERVGNTVTLENSYSPSENPDEKTTTRTVKKLWDDKGYENKRPTVVLVELLKNGSVFDTAELSESGGWSYTWEMLDRFDESGEYITWSIKEQTVPGYIPKTELNGYTFVLTNSYERPEIPRTGMLWWPVLLLACGGLLLLLIGILLKKREQNEKA